MSETFLHLDRIGEVDEDTVFELSFENIHPAGPSHRLDGHGIYSNVGRDDYDFLEQYFPEGLSSHGKNYLYNNIRLSKDVLSNQEQFLEPEFIIRMFSEIGSNHNWVREMVFELIRQDCYPDRLSRFQSVFAARNEEELQKWMALPAVDADSGDIYEVTAESHLVVDSSFLDLSEEYQTPRDLAIELKGQAQKYWAGNITRNAVQEVLLKPPIEVDSYVNSI